MDRQNDEDGQKRIWKRKALSGASHLTRAQVLRRRITNINRLSYYLRAIYWLLLERMKNLYKRFIFNFRRRPSSDAIIVNYNSSFNKCAFHDCQRNHMPLTTFCYFHILSDPRQRLYKPCQYVHRISEEAGPITCGKPVLRSAVPSLCKVHMEEAKKHLNMTLEQAGVAITSTGSYRPPKFHVLVAEFVNQIQAKRRAALRGNESNIIIIGSETKMIDEQ